MSASATRFGDLPGEAARLWKDEPAITFRGTRLTFGELSAEVDRAARALLARGIGKGDVVGLWMTNRTEFPIAYFAAMRIGAIVAPTLAGALLDGGWSPEDLYLAFGVVFLATSSLILLLRTGPGLRSVASHPAAEGSSDAPGVSTERRPAHGPHFHEGPDVHEEDTSARRAPGR